MKLILTKDTLLLILNEYYQKIVYIIIKLIDELFIYDRLSL